VLGDGLTDPLCGVAAPLDGDELCPADPVLEPADCGFKDTA